MHEFSLMQDLVTKVLAVAEDNAASRVTRVDVWLGALSHLSAAHFTEHFERAVQGTLAEGARLMIEVSVDIDDPLAADIRLLSVEVS